jgi:hypothetical protein
MLYSVLNTVERPAVSVTRSVAAVVAAGGGCAGSARGGAGACGAAGIWA